MTPEQFQQLMTAQRELYKLHVEGLKINKLILKKQEEITKKLDRLVASKPIIAPNYQKPLSEFKDFNWDSIHAKVIAKDADGVCEVEWHNQIYVRRSPENKFAPAIWFSCHDGKGYQKLITFKQTGLVEPVSRKALNQLNN